MVKATLLIGLAAGAVIGATVGRKKITELWQRPEVKDTWRKANRFVAEKAPTLHGMGGALADAMPARRAS